MTNKRATFLLWPLFVLSLATGTYSADATSCVGAEIPT